MLAYVTRRLLGAILLLFGLVTVVFFVVRLAPGDPLLRYISPEVDPQSIELMRQRFGLDQPLPLQYLDWLRSTLLEWDFGESITRQRPVTELLAQAIPQTLRLTCLALLVRILGGCALGIVAATRRGGWDRSITLGSLFVYSMPTFWLSLMLLLVFAFQLRWLPPGQISSLDRESMSLLEGFWDSLRHLVLPVFVLGVGGMASTARYMRASMLEVLRLDFVRTARAKGLSERAVIWRHALRNALLPVATLLGLSIPSLVGGAVVVEYIFSWPGMGQLTLQAIFARDYPVIMATTVLSGVLVIAGNLLSDLLYSWLDPRIQLGK
jgi:peptide/nickel transport system permease protein